MCAIMEGLIKYVEGLFEVLERAIRNFAEVRDSLKGLFGSLSLKWMPKQTSSTRAMWNTLGV